MRDTITMRIYIRRNIDYNYIVKNSKRRITRITTPNSTVNSLRFHETVQNYCVTLIVAFAHYLRLNFHSYDAIMDSTFNQNTFQNN